MCWVKKTSCYHAIWCENVPTVPKLRLFMIRHFFWRHFSHSSHLERRTDNGVLKFSSSFSRTIEMKMNEIRLSKLKVTYEIIANWSCLQFSEKAARALRKIRNFSSYRLIKTNDTNIELEKIYDLFYEMILYQ